MQSQMTPREPETAQSKHIWRVKSTTSPCEPLCVVEVQPHLSREDKGKVPLSVDGVAYAASTWGAQSPLNREAKFGAQRRIRRESSMASSNQRVLISSVRFAPLSEVREVSSSADSVAYVASTLRDASKVPSRKARTKALYSASYLRHNAKDQSTIVC